MTSAQHYALAGMLREGTAYEAKKGGGARRGSSRPPQHIGLWAKEGTQEQTAVYTNGLNKKIQALQGSCKPLRGPWPAIRLSMKQNVHGALCTGLLQTQTEHRAGA